MAFMVSPAAEGEHSNDATHHAPTPSTLFASLAVVRSPADCALDPEQVASCGTQNSLDTGPADCQLLVLQTVSCCNRPRTSSAARGI